MTHPRTATIVSRIFEPEGSAAANRLGALARGLERAGFLTRVLTTRPPSGLRSTANIRRWPVLRDRSGAVRGYLQYASFDIPAFFRLLFARRSDVVVVEPPPTTGVVSRIACAIRRIPYLYYSADVSSTAAEGIGVPRPVVAVVRAMERWALRGAAGVLAVSDAVAGEVIALGAHPDRVAVVGTGIDTTSFRPDGAMPVRTDDEPYFVYAGTMSEIQGAGVFVEAFRVFAEQHPGVRLMMFGGGVEVDTLRDAARPLGDRVQFPGVIGAEELAGWLRGATAGLASVRPTRGYDFAFATKALTSLSCGTPVIYAGVGPLASLIAEHDLGWATEWDADAVAASMAAARSRVPAPDPRLSEWVGEHFSMHAVADRAATAIRSVARSR